MTTPDTVWILPAPDLATRLSLPAVPLPVTGRTAADLRAERMEPAAIALDVSDWLAVGNGTPVQRRVMRRWVATLAYVAAIELLDRHRPSPAAKLLEVGLRHAGDDPSLRAVLALARWDCGHQIDALGHLALAVDQYAAAGQAAPLLDILAARALSAAGRDREALAILEPLAATEPRVPLFWDLFDAVQQRADARRAA
jgi:predicted Zn-dependent protease